MAHVGLGMPWLESLGVPVTTLMSLKPETRNSTGVTEIRVPLKGFYMD